MNGKRKMKAIERDREIYKDIKFKVKTRQKMKKLKKKKKKNIFFLCCGNFILKVKTNRYCFISFLLFLLSSYLILT